MAEINGQGPAANFHEGDELSVEELDQVAGGNESDEFGVNDRCVNEADGCGASGNTGCTNKVSGCG